MCFNSYSWTLPVAIGHLKEEPTNIYATAVLVVLAILHFCRDGGSEGNL